MCIGTSISPSARNSFAILIAQLCFVPAILGRVGSHMLIKTIAFLITVPSRVVYAYSFLFSCGVGIRVEFLCVVFETN